MSDLPAAARWLPEATFAGAVAVVTGGGTGLGLQVSRGLAALGASVVIASRKAEHHRELLDEAAAKGWTAEALVLDVRESDKVRAAADALVARHGKVDLLVNNAAGNFLCSAERMSANAWRSVVGIALDGTFYCSQAFGRAMIARRSGAILNVVATYAKSGMALVAHSASAKAGVLALTKSLAAEWAPHSIRVNAIAPGPFHSQGAGANLWPSEQTERAIQEQIPLARFGTAEEVAAHCLYLLSPACAYVTGECFVVDGGLSLGSRMWDPPREPARNRTQR